MLSEYTRQDGGHLPVINGFREQWLYSNPSVNPKPHWSDMDYASAIETKIRKHKKRIGKLTQLGMHVNGAKIIEVGCGAGIDSLLLAMEPVDQVVAIDQRLRLFLDNEEGERARRLAGTLFKKLGFEADVETVLTTLPITFESVDVMQLPYPNDNFDFLYSRSALEHFKPIEKALTEMSRVVKPQGLMNHAIDPFYWRRGCHRGGLVDIPWAHARLSLDEFQRFVANHEDTATAHHRLSTLQELNRFTLKQWRQVFEFGPFEILYWKESLSQVAEQLLDEYPDVVDTVLDGVEHKDLVHNRIIAWLKNKPQ